MQPESRKILGVVNKDDTGFTERQDLKILPTYPRVSVSDGHLGNVSLRCAKRPPPTAQLIKKAMTDFMSEV